MLKQQKPCSIHETHVPFEHGFWPTSLVNATWLHKNKIAEAPRFSVSFDIVNDIFKKSEVN